MNIRVEGSEVKDKDTGKKIGVINGSDILTYPAGKKLGNKAVPTSLTLRVAKSAIATTES